MGECPGEVPGEFGVFFRGLGGAGCLLFLDLGLVTRVCSLCEKLLDSLQVSVCVILQ